MHKFQKLSIRLMSALLEDVRFLQIKKSLVFTIVIFELALKEKQVLGLNLVIFFS